jgi:hypothetical protein
MLASRLRIISVWGMLVIHDAAAVSERQGRFAASAGQVAGT